MSDDVDLKAGAILERLSAALSDAQVDYTCSQDMHEFVVTTGGVTHAVGFAHRVLEDRDVAEIERFVEKLAAELKSSTEPRSIRVGARG